MVKKILRILKRIIIILLVIAIIAVIVLSIMPQGLARRLQGLDPDEIVLDYSTKSVYFAISKSGDEITFTKFLPYTPRLRISVEYKYGEKSFTLDGEKMTISPDYLSYIPLMEEISPIVVYQFYMQDVRYGDGSCVMGVSPDKIDVELTGSVIDFAQAEIGDGLYAFLFFYYGRYPQ